MNEPRPAMISPRRVFIEINNQPHFVLPSEGGAPADVMDDYRQISDGANREGARRLVALRKPGAGKAGILAFVSGGQGTRIASWRYVPPRKEGGPEKVQAIEKLFETSVASLKRWNALRTNTLRVGQRLTILTPRTAAIATR